MKSLKEVGFIRDRMEEVDELDEEERGLCNRFEFFVD